jgi:hypothetical protein
MKSIINYFFFLIAISSFLLFETSTANANNMALDSVKKAVDLQPNEFLLVIFFSPVQCSACTEKYIQIFKCLRENRKIKNCKYFRSR